MAEGSSWSVVDDGTLDVAMRVNLEKMMTEATGRQPFQQVYLWATSNKATTTQYVPGLDGPDAVAPCPILPGNQELIPDENAKLYLEVGLIFGDEPHKHMPKGKARDKEREAERVRRGIMRRDEHAMRVFTPVTDYIATQAKFYVGCRAMAGRLSPRVISADCVFFYPELWDGINHSLPSKQRLAELNKACRERAAINKTAAKHTVIAITPDELSKFLAANPLVVSRPEHLSTMLHLQWFMFEQTNDRSYAEAMISLLEMAHPDLKYGPQTSTEGVCAFMDFDEQLTDELALKFKDELTATYSFLSPDAELIKQIHAYMCGTIASSSAEESKQAPKIGDQLPWGSIGFFIDYCHSSIEAGPAGGYDPTVLRAEVNRALKMSKIHLHHITAHSTLSNIATGENKEDGEGGDENNGDGGAESGGNQEGGMGLSELRKALALVRQVIAAVDISSKRSLETIVQEHGGLLKHASLKDMMEKMGDAVDKATLQSSLCQLATLYTAIYTAKHQKQVEILGVLTDYLGRLLIITEEPDKKDA